MTPEQVAQNAVIGNTITQVFHVVIILLEMLGGIVLWRYRQENQKQQAQIDECRRVIAGLDAKLDNVLKQKEGD